VELPPLSSSGLGVSCLAATNRSINSSLTDELTRRQAIRKLNPNVQIMLPSEGNQFVLSLPSMIPAPSLSPTPAP
jgi:hypothetical protein